MQAWAQDYSSSYLQHSGSIILEMSDVPPEYSSVFEAAWLPAHPADIVAAADTVEYYIRRLNRLVTKTCTSHGEAVAELQGAIARVSAEWKADLSDPLACKPWSS